MENLKNNTVILEGTIVKEPEYSHEVIGEKFYMMNTEVNRTSENCDIIPVLVSDRAWDIESLALGEKVKIIGSYRSYNKPEKNKTKLLLYVLAENIQEKESEKDKNSIELAGYICKEPVYRKTPLGREIADLLLAVNRPYGKSDYIPCILWGRNARYAERLEIGKKLKVSGRIQSREYNKKISETEVEKRTAYEVSVSRIEAADKVIQEVKHGKL